MDSAKHLQKLEHQKQEEHETLKEEFGTNKRQYRRVIKGLKKTTVRSKEEKQETTDRRIG